MMAIKIFYSAISNLEHTLDQDYDLLLMINDYLCGKFLDIDFGIILWSTCKAAAYFYLRIYYYSKKYSIP